MKGLVISVYKTIKYISKLRFLAFLELLYITFRKKVLICIKYLSTGYLSSINFYAPCITPTSYNVVIVK